MTTSLNLYATKVFSEQPTALWALDDTTDYVALIPEANQDLSTWSVSGATVGGEFSEDPVTPPFRSLPTNRVLETLGSGGTITFTSPVALDSTTLNAELGSVAIGAYFITYDRGTKDSPVFVRLGYSTDSEEVIRGVSLPATRDWAFVSQTFSLPEDLTNFRFIIEIGFDTEATPYEIAINGIKNIHKLNLLI